MMDALKKTMAIVTMLACSAAAWAGPTEVDGMRIDREIYRSYESNWRKYARFVCPVGEGYALIPNYDRRYDNSLSLSDSQAMDKLEIKSEVRQGTLVKTVVKRPPRADAAALASALPKLEIGQYGRVQSVEVVKVIGDNEMIVKNIWLIDRSVLAAEYKADEADMVKRNGEADHQTLRFDYKTRLAQMEQQEDRDEGFENEFRLVGYDTRGLRVGDRYEGPKKKGFQVGVVRWEIPRPDEKEEKKRRRDKDPRLVLTELEQAMRSRIDEEGFKKVLAERDMTVVEFVDVMRTMRERHRDREESEEMILNSLQLGELEED